MKFSPSPNGRGVGPKGREVRLRVCMDRAVRVRFRHALRPVTGCNCAVARRGGEQQEVNDQSAGYRTRFGWARLASLPLSGDAWTCRRAETRHAERERVKAVAGARKVIGDGMVWKAVHMNQGELAGGTEPVRSQSAQSNVEAR